MCATYTPHLILLDFIILIMFKEDIVGDPCLNEFRSKNIFECCWVLIQSQCYKYCRFLTARDKTVSQMCYSTD
jgi:hypothetical protein